MSGTASDGDTSSGEVRVARFDDLESVESGPKRASVDSGRWRVAALTGMDDGDQRGEPQPHRVVDLGVGAGGEQRDVPVARLDGPAPKRSAAKPRRRQSQPERHTGGREGRRQRHSAPSQQPEPAETDPAAVAREICLRLLTERPRTRQELARALRRKRVPDDVAAAVLDRFDEVGLIDDAAFAEQWTYSRHTHRGLGRRAIAAELRRKGVDDEIAREALAQIDEESERERARALVERRLRGMPLDTPERRARAARSLVGMLARKGYVPGTAYEVVRTALAEAGADVEELGGADIDD